jgi:uncharacterized small protein (DUF1192 family)
VDQWLVYWSVRHVTTGFGLISFAPTGGHAMEEELLPRKKVVHEVGQDLALLSVDELAERISLLRDEIARLEQAMTGKRASLQAANTFFKR